MDEVLTYRHVTICYGEKKVVEDVGFSVKAGEILGIVGESGSGKSTLLRAATGLLGSGGCVTRGDIFYRPRDGRLFPDRIPSPKGNGIRRYRGGPPDLPDLDDSDLREIRGREIGMIWQDPGASLCPVRRIVDLAFEAGRAHGLYGRGKQEKMRCAADLAEYLCAFDLKDPAHILAAYPFELSGGMLQRVTVAMTMVMRPSVILADEPTSALDVVSGNLVAGELMAAARQFGAAVILVTHNIGLAAGVTDRILVMKDGKIQEYGETKKVLQSPESGYTRKLLDSVPVLSVPAVGKQGQ